jgi:hypothetical protein
VFRSFTVPSSRSWSRTTADLVCRPTDTIPLASEHTEAQIAERDPGREFLVTDRGDTAECTKL